MTKRTALIAMLAVVLPTAAGAAVHHPNKVPGTDCQAFPKDNVWHADIRNLPVHARSSAWLKRMHAGSTNLHPDFGPSYGEQPVPYGIPITVVGGSHQKVHVGFTYSSESDHVRYPLGADTKIEGGRSSSGDRHAIVVDKSTCRLYETWSTYKRPSGWHAGSGATWSLERNKLRPATWTSADAAGLPILPGVLRYGEVERKGYVDHAIRFTTDTTDRKFIWPARHQAGAVSNHRYPPMGARFRLKAAFPVGLYRNDTQVVLRAMKHFGLLLADNGSAWYFQGQASGKWPSGLLDELKSIPAKAFVAVDESCLRIDKDSARAKAHC